MDNFSLPATCKTDDVWLEEDGTPLVFWNRKWSPICGHGFWDNDNGATAFCNKLGYKSGTVNRIESSYSIARLRIGRCHTSEDLAACNRRTNQDNKYCHPQDTAAISITCGQQGDKYSSCELGIFIL